MKRQYWRRLFLRGGQLHPLWRVAVYLVGLLAGTLVLDTLVMLAYAVLMLLTGRPLLEVLRGIVGGQFPPLLLLLIGLERLGLTLGLALLLGRFLDREPMETMGLATSRGWRDVAVGLALGLGAMLLIGGARLALGWASLVRGTGTVWSFLLDAAALLPAAVAEEVAFRGYLQRALTTWRGPVVGVATTSILFALFHALNPHPSWLAMLNIGLAGVVFGLAVERSGTLWLAVGTHFAWNLAQGPLLGMPVSGLSWQGLLALGAGGPPLWTGGLFGPEGGLLATGALLLSLLPLWACTRRPATVTAACRRQRAAVEASFGPLPSLHRHVDVGHRLYDDIARAVWQGDRQGEVVLILRRPNGDLLLHTKSFYPDGVYRLPSGGIKRGEAVVVAARRETKEETGFSLQELRPLGLLTCTLRDGRRRLFFHSWLVRGEVEGEPVLGDSEERITDFRWVSPDALVEIASELQALEQAWAGWGRLRALAHEQAARWLVS